MPTALKRQRELQRQSAEVGLIVSESYRFIVYEHGCMKRIVCYAFKSDECLGTLYLDTEEYDKGKIKLEQITKSFSNLSAIVLFTMLKDLERLRFSVKSLHKYSKEQKVNPS